MNLFAKIVSLNISSTLEHRAAFFMFRVTSLIQMATLFVIWEAISRSNQPLFGFSRPMMLTYALATNVVRSLVFSSASDSVQEQICSGKLNNYLQKPLNYLKYWFAQDVGRKLLHFSFSCIELFIIIKLTSFPLYISSPLQATISLVAVLTAAILYFFISFLISITTFWSPEGGGWPQRFFSLVLIEGLSGALFPLTIFNHSISNILQILPPAFLIYHPLQIFLGKTSLVQSIHLIILGLCWTIFFYFFAIVIFHKGLKAYQANGG